MFDSNKVMPILEYYQSHNFNPVPINVEDREIWETHKTKRENLYERQLKIPILLFRNRSVIEFGCNSGENALYLASIGARLTLVEPNAQVLPRLRRLFEVFGLSSSISELINTDIDGFHGKGKYDIMLAEGFLTMIPNRADMFLKVCSLIAPGGYGVISFDDLYGSLFEVVRQTIFRRVCEMEDIKDFHGEESLTVAKELYGEDFARLKASRPFEAWWQDVLLNPYVSWDHLGTYQEFLSLLEKAHCEIHSTSPLWTLIDHFSWYKNVLKTSERHQHFLDDWYRVFPFFLTGLSLAYRDADPASLQAVAGVSDFIKGMSGYNFLNKPFDSVSFPLEMDKYFSESRITILSSLNSELKGMMGVLKGNSEKEVLAFYKKTDCLRNLWGMSSPYISFKKLN